MVLGLTLESSVADTWRERERERENGTIMSLGINPDLTTCVGHGEHPYVCLL
jgi:hypothetical protein